MKLASILICVFIFSATGQTAIDNQSVIANSCIFDDCFINSQPEAALLTHDDSGTKRIDQFDDKWTELANTGFQARYARTEIFAIDSGKSDGLVTSPNPRHNYYDEVVSWIKDNYRARVAYDNYTPIRLFLLGLGLIGLGSIRRKLEKNRSAQISGKKHDWILRKI